MGRIVVAKGLLLCTLGIWLLPPSALAQQSQGQKPQNRTETQAAPSEANPDDTTAGEENTEEVERQRQRSRMRMVTAAEMKIDGKEISMLTGRQPVDNEDYKAIDALKPGDVLLLTQSQTIKLKTDANLRFGDAVLKTENFAKNYPGVYGIWIMKSADGWDFVFNEKPDVWGTMYDPSANVAEVPVQYKQLDEPTDAMKFELKKEDNGGVMKITWGTHEWSAPFAVVQ